MNQILKAFAFLSTLQILSATPSEILSYKSIPSRVRNSNIELAAARFRIDEAVAMASQAGRLSNPSLDTGIDHNIQSAEGRIEIGLSQKFPITNRLGLEKEIGLTEVKAAEAEVRNAERLLIAEARQEFVRVLSIRERKELLKKQKQLAADLAEFISGASVRGEISSLDAAQARLAALRITTEERRLETEETATLGRLRPIVGIAAGKPVSISGSTPSLELPALTQSDRPDLTAARIKLQAANSGIALEQARKQEDLEASVFAAGERIDDAPVGLRNEGIIGIKLSIPFPFWDDNQGAIDAATARRNRKEQEINALSRDIQHEVKTAFTEMQQWAALVSELDKKLLPLAKEQTNFLETAYRNGQGDLQAVLASREQTLELTASKLDAIREFQLARIRYQAANGSQF
ncbi:MAG: TolC family protein [Akkermansiaceae bacterium]